MRSILFHIGPIPIRAYGVMIMVGFLLGLWRAVRVSEKRGVASERVMDSALIALISGIVGARLLFLFLSARHLGWRIFADALRIWEGGLSFHGGLIAAVGSVALYARVKKASFLLLADVLAPSLAIGYAFARVGCFLNGCCYGVPTDLPWAVRFTDSASGALSPPCHPVQLYAFGISLLIFFILTRVERLQWPAGSVFVSYVFLYSIYRFGVEFLRKGATAEVWFAGLTQAQAASILGVILSVGALFLLRRCAK